MRGARLRAFGLGLASLGLGLVAATTAQAEEWHEAYRAGLQAQARGDHAKAIASLRRAVAQHPEPGRNVVTYGTNIEPRYFPYLRLAESHLALGQTDLARSALETSLKWAREPEAELLKLQARLEAPQLPAALPQPSALPATPAPTPLPASPPLTLATATPEPALPPSVAPDLPVAATPPPRVRPQAPTSPPVIAPSVADPGRLGSIEVVSQPPGASAYLDDEPLGSTDPQTGRLVKRGLQPGRHRVRLALPDHEDGAREVDLPPGGSVSLDVRLAPRAAAASGIDLTLVASGAVALALALAVGWMTLRRPAIPTLDAQLTPAAPASRSPSTPAGHNPGARRDEQGQEWFGPFRLVELLGRGGMASVYRAERGSELSALKRPLASLLDDGDFLERFLREAEIGRSLNHPNIVRILGRGDVAGVPYFTMELLAGQTLQAVAAAGAMEPRRAAAIVVQLAEALDFAHSKGVVHRDLKPSNVMLLPDGTAKVMDFGIARAKRFDGLTATGAFLGTPDYVSPEIIEGRGAETGSDLYSLGVIFYELLAGRRPFLADTPFGVLRQHCSEQPRPLASLHAGVPPEFDALVRQMLAKAPADRPGSAEALVLALRDWLNRAA